MNPNDKKVELNNKMQMVLKDLEKTKLMKTTSENTGVPQSDIYSWLDDDKSQFEPYSSFKKEFNKIFPSFIPKKNKKPVSKTKRRKRKNKKKNYQKNVPKQFKQEKCDGFAKQHISKRNMVTNSNPEIDELMDLIYKFELENNYDVAIDYCDEVIRKYPNYVDAYNKKGCLLLKSGFYEEAFDYFNLSLSLSKNNYDAHIGIVYSLYNILLFDDSLSNSQIFDYEMQIVINLNTAAILNKEALLLKSKIFKDLGNYNESFDSLNEYIKFYTNSIDNSIGSKKSIEVLYHKAELYYILKKYWFSYFILEELLKYDRSNPKYLFYQALSAINLKKFDKALDNFDKILFEDSDNIEVNLSKGELLVSLHRYDEALIHFNSCPIELVPNEYKKLIEHTHNQIHKNHSTDFYATTLTNFDGFNFVYTCIQQGFRRIYAVNLVELREKVLKNNLIWHNINFNEPPNYKDQEIVTKYFAMYGFDVEYNELLSKIISVDFLKKVFENDYTVEVFSNSKVGIERQLIDSVIHHMKNALKIAERRNNTGYFGVIRGNRTNSNWRYLDLFKMGLIGSEVIYADSLDELEKKVKNENSFWFIFDEDLSEKTREEDLKLNGY